MYDIEINKSINQIDKIFHLFGMWRIDDEPMVGSGGLLSDDWNASIFLINVSVAGSVIGVKMAYILWKKREIREFIQDIGTHSVVHYEEFVKVNDKVTKLMKFSSSLYLIICVTDGALLIFCSPIFSNEKKLPIDIWFPFDWKNNAIIHWIAYIYVLIAMIFSVVGSSLNIIIWYLMINCAIKYQILANHIKDIFLMKPTKTKRKMLKDEKEKLFLQELIGLINDHHNIQKTIDRFKSCFGNLFFAQITTSGICICASIYALAFSCRGQNLIHHLVQCTVLLYNLFDIFMVMYLGNEIILSRDRLSYCLFASDWLQHSKSSQKCIIIVIEVLKQPHELVIGKLYPVNMKTFASIMNLAYSIFNILQNVE